LGKDGQCISELKYTEQHPLKWTLTRQFNSFFWYIGEIIGDWYPLLRTKAVATDRVSKFSIYASCGLYNLSKLSIPISQLFLNPTKLYTNDGIYNKNYVDHYYNYYSCILVLIIASSLLYDITIYIVLKKKLFSKQTREYDFLNKFRTISEYRIVVSAITGVIGLPFTLITAITKVILYNNEMKDLNFSIEEFRNVINSVQYMIIFIDQILLIRAKNDSSMESYEDNKDNTNSNYYYNSGVSSGNYYESNSNSSNYYDSKLNSSNYYDIKLNSNVVNNTIRDKKGYLINYKNSYPAMLNLNRYNNNNNNRNNINNNNNNNNKNSNNNNYPSMSNLNRYNKNNNNNNRNNNNNNNNNTDSNDYPAMNNLNSYNNNNNNRNNISNNNNNNNNNNGNSNNYPTMNNLNNYNNNNNNNNDNSNNYPTMNNLNNYNNNNNNNNDNSNNYPTMNNLNNYNNNNNNNNNNSNNYPTMNNLNSYNNNNNNRNSNNNNNNNSNSNNNNNNGNSNNNNKNNDCSNNNFNSKEDEKKLIRNFSRKKE